MSVLKKKEDLKDWIDQISSTDSPVGMDAVYVHALILDKLHDLEERVVRLEQTGRVATANASVPRSTDS